MQKCFHYLFDRYVYLFISHQRDIELFYEMTVTRKLIKYLNDMFFPINFYFVCFTSEYHILPVNMNKNTILYKCIQFSIFLIPG